MLWALEEMQLPFDLAGMDHPHDLNTEAYRRLPFEQIPSIDDDGWCYPNPPPSSSTWRKKSGCLIPADRAGEAQVVR